MAKFYVYIHLRLDTYSIFYVGKGKDNRAYSTNNRNNHWHNIVNKYGYTVEIIEYFENENAALKKEEELISFYRKSGLVLANILNGGISNSGYRHTEESKLKLKIAHTGRKRDIKTIEKQRLKVLGVPKSKEHREKLSKARLGVKIPKKYKSVICSNGEIYLSLSDAAEKLSLDISHISKCCRGKIKQIKGYSFKYYNKS